MTLYLFKLLSPDVQLYYVLGHGTHLAQRWEGAEEENAVNLYYLADGKRGFFAEVGMENERALVFRSFSSAVPLEDYAHYVRLPEW